MKSSTSSRASAAGAVGDNPAELDRGAERFDTLLVEDSSSEEDREDARDAALDDENTEVACGATLGNCVYSYSHVSMYTIAKHFHTHALAGEMRSFEP